MPAVQRLSLEPEFPACPELEGVALSVSGRRHLWLGCLCWVGGGVMLTLCEASPEPSVTLHNNRRELLNCRSVELTSGEKVLSVMHSVCTVLF